MVEFAANKSTLPFSCPIEYREEAVRLKWRPEHTISLSPGIPARPTMGEEHANHQPAVSALHLRGEEKGPQPQKAWRVPKVSVIDIRRTMITLGSGSDGVIGST